MENTFEKILDILIGIMILFIFPLLYFGQRQDTITQQVVLTQTSVIVDTVRTQGYITKTMYETYLDYIEHTHIIGEIHLEHKELALEPEYRFKTVDEVIDGQNKEWGGSNVYTYIPVTTQVPIVTDPIHNDGLSMNTETNESVLAAAVDGPSDPSHVHTEACYNGHRHSEGSNNFIHTHVHVSSCRTYTQNIWRHVTCGNCGYKFINGAAYYHWDDETNSPKYDGNGGFSTDCSNCRSTNLISETVYEYGYSCHYDKDINGDGLNDNTVGTTISYEYMRDKPQSTDKATYSSGCYSYHVSKYFPGSYDYYGTTYYYTNPDSIISLMHYYGIDKYCEIPWTYTFRFWWNTTVHGELSAYISYNAQLQSDGSVVYVLQSCDSGYGANPKSVITLEELQKLSYAWYLQSVVGPNLSPSGSTGVNMTFKGRFKVCDHTDINKWYPICDQTQVEIPSCNQMVVSMIPTHPIQTLYINNPLLTTASILFKDGSSKVVVCNADYIPNTVVSNKVVTLSYSGVTAAITVTVIPKTKVCINGHTYNLNNDGSDPGCIYCNSWLSDLVVTFPQNGELTIYQGATLESSGVIILATYLSGRKEHLTSGYANNLDSIFIGNQVVTISYKGKYTSLKVTTKRRIVTCGVCGKYYEKYPDDTDPGCPYCAAQIPVFTGNVLQYFGQSYSNEILNELYEGSGTYYFKEGDYFTIDIGNRNKTLGSKLLGMIIPNIPENTIHVTYGGSIRDRVVKY